VKHAHRAIFDTYMLYSIIFLSRNSLFYTTAYTEIMSNKTEVQILIDNNTQESRCFPGEANLISPISEFSLTFT
jgi:hypothetical protein